MNECKVIFATVVIFAAGVIAGGLLVNYIDLTHAKMAHSRPAPTTAVNGAGSPSPAGGNNNAPKSNPARTRMPEILTKEFVDRLESELQLSLGQRADIEKIIADGQDESRKSFLDIRAASREKIRKQLNPRQVKLFDELLKQKANRKNNPPPPNTNAPAMMAVTNAAPAAAANAAETK